MGRKRFAVGKPILSMLVAVSMAFTMTIAPGLASAKAAEDGGQPVAKMLTTAGFPEWAIDDGQDAQGGITTQAGLPSTYDLRSEGLVTPAKYQNPWNSCWAFGGTSAAEISMLSAYGTTYEKSGLDLSERHLICMAFQPVTESVNASQVGEGLYPYDTSKNGAYDAGGKSVYVTTVYSQGVGPVAESDFPYRGASGMLTAQDYAAHPENLEADTKSQLAMMVPAGMTVDEYLEAAAAKKNQTPEQILQFYEDQIMQLSAEYPTYTKYDDWSIPEKNDSGVPNRMVSGGVVLKNGNVLPDYWNDDNSELNQTSIDAIKQELVNGRGVSIMFYGDQSGEYTMSDVDAEGNSENNSYNQYINTPLGVDHSVCIIGWDDNYAASNFRIAAPGDGAWIVKNSYGCTSDLFEDDLGNVVNKKNYGIKNAEGEYTGCFYLSYYDQTIGQPESMEFTANLGNADGFYTLQYDYMPATAGFYATDATSGDNGVQSSANVFSSDEPMVLKSVSTSTSEANSRVTFAIYALNDNAKNPTDGTMLYRTSCNFEYAGFHRLDLDKEIPIAANKPFSVVSTVSTLNGDGLRAYNVTANRGLSKEFCDIGIAQGINLKSYSKAVVNEGESFLYSNGGWQSWKEYLEGSGLAEKGYEVDNFSIKVYADPPADDAAKQVIEAQAASTIASAKATAAENKAAAAVTAKKAAEAKADEAEQAKKEAENRASAAQADVTAAQGNVAAAQEATTAALNAKKEAEKKLASATKDNPVKITAKTVNAKAKKKTTISKSKAFTVKSAKGSVAFYKISGSSKITVSKAGNVTVKKGLKKGTTYKVKALVTVAGGKVKGVKYAPANKTVTLKVKVS